MVLIDLNELEIKIISPEDDLGFFDCDDADLNEFVIEDALNQMKARINVTYLCKYKDQIVAFFTLSADSIKINIEDLEEYKDKNVPYREFPAVKIGRLAVSNSHQRMNVGTNLILLIIGKTFELSKQIGVRYVSVDAYMGSVTFYKKRYFTEFVQDSQKRTVQMYLDILKLSENE